VVNVVKKAVTIILVFLLTLTIPALIFYGIENTNLKKQISTLDDELASYKTANLETALGITEIQTAIPSIRNSPSIDSPDVGNFKVWSNVWITGSVFNSGKSMAYNAGLRVLAFENNSNLLMNTTVPLMSGTFSYNDNESLIPDITQPTPFVFGNILSQQNTTVRISIYHEGTFSNSTTYELIPVWTNSP
jgi:hypothetical protein